MFKRVSGTKDILPDEAGYWQAIEATAREIFSLYNYREIRTPVIEDASLFNRSLGEGTEIVQKQMFLIQNKEDLCNQRLPQSRSLQLCNNHSC